MNVSPVESLFYLIQENCNVQTVTPEMTFKQLGMDSLDYILLIKEIRHKIGDISDKQAQEATKVSDLVAVFSN